MTDAAGKNAGVSIGQSHQRSITFLWFGIARPASLPEKILRLGTLCEGLEKSASQIQKLTLAI